MSSDALFCSEKSRQCCSYCGSHEGSANLLYIINYSCMSSPLYLMLVAFHLKLICINLHNALPPLSKPICMQVSNWTNSNCNLHASKWLDRRWLSIIHERVSAHDLRAIVWGGERRHFLAKNVIKALTVISGVNGCAYVWGWVTSDKDGEREWGGER